MTWRVEWSPRAIHDLLHLPHWRDAARVDAAIERYAATGEGDLRHFAVAEYRLRVGNIRVRLSFDQASKTMHVWSVYRLR